MFGREIPCETTRARKVTVKPLVHTDAGTIDRYIDGQKPNAIPTELSRHSSVGLQTERSRVCSLPLLPLRKTHLLQVVLLIP